MTFPIRDDGAGVRNSAVNRGAAVLAALWAAGFAELAEAGLDEAFAAMQSEDYTAALRELKPLAEQGAAEAQFLLGNLYVDGFAVEEDLDKAFGLYRLAAEQGLSYAQLALGDAYFTGQGVEENDTEAMNWYERAARQGHPQAQFNLGSMYSVGSGRPRDFVQAYMWCSVSATFPPAGAERREAERRCDRILPQMSKQQIGEARALAQTFVPKTEGDPHPVFRFAP